MNKSGSKLQSNLNSFKGKTYSSNDVNLIKKTLNWFKKTPQHYLFIFHSNLQKKAPKFHLMFSLCQFKQ